MSPGVWCVLALLPTMLLSSLLDNERTLNCYRCSNLPMLDDCVELLNAIAVTASDPGGHTVRRWGPDEPSTSQSWTLPKFFWINRPLVPGRPYHPSTCQLWLDYLPREGYDNYDTFSYEDVRRIGDGIAMQCLLARGLVGYNFPGPRKTVYESLRRGPPTIRSPFSTSMDWVQSWNVTVRNTTLDLFLSNGSSSPSDPCFSSTMDSTAS